MITRLYDSTTVITQKLFCYHRRAVALSPSVITRQYDITTMITRQYDDDNTPVRQYDCNNATNCRVITVVLYCRVITILLSHFNHRIVALSPSYDRVITITLSHYHRRTDALSSSFCRLQMCIRSKELFPPCDIMTNSESGAQAVRM